MAEWSPLTVRQIQQDSTIGSLGLGPDGPVIFWKPIPFNHMNTMFVGEFGSLMVRAINFWQPILILAEFPCFRMRLIGKSSTRRISIAII